MIINDIATKWSEISYDGTYAHSDENRQAVLGYFLVSLGIDLERLPRYLFEPYTYYPSSTKRITAYTVEKVYVQDIVGTSRQEYAEDNQVLFSFMKLKRIKEYIMNGSVTRNKYLWMLKQKEQKYPIILSKSSDNSFYVDGNGNHRVLAYKIMMLAEIAHKYEWVYDDDYDLFFKGFDEISKKYWIYARVLKY